jgi:hypothetical protein
MKISQKLVDAVMEQIKLDAIIARDFTAIEELVKTCKVENLIGFLSDEAAEEFLKDI